MGNDNISKSISKFPAVQNGVGLEIGVWRGKSAEILWKQLNPKLFYLVDPYSIKSVTDVWIGDDNPHWSGTGKIEDIKNNKIQVAKNRVNSIFAAAIKAGKVKTIYDYSNQVVPTLKDSSLDWAHVDGAHTYEAVLEDLELVWPKIKPGGVVYGDDFKKHEDWGVDQAVMTFLQIHLNEIDQFYFDRTIFQFVLTKTR